MTRGTGPRQQLQQFVTSSAWDYAQVRGRLARWAQACIDPCAFVVDDTGFPALLEPAENNGVLPEDTDPHMLTDISSPCVRYRGQHTRGWRSRRPSAAEFGAL